MCTCSVTQGLIFSLTPLSLEMCDEQLNFTMCPLCDGACDFWHLSTACGTARASHLFDNPATVFFAIFMSLWGEVTCVLKCVRVLTGGLNVQLLINIS